MASLSCFLSLFLIFLHSAAAGAEPQPCRPSDLHALRDFAGALTGGTILSSWPSGSHSCCVWEGVTCSPAGNNQSWVVTELRLPRRRLRGTISPSLGNLQNLRLLDLSGNHLSGVLPPHLSSLRRLHLLDLSFNSFSGSLAAISGIASLRSANLSSNSFNGTLLSLRGFAGLTTLNISNNSIAGPASPDLCFGSNTIRLLDISSNSLSGPLPGDSLSNCSSLQKLYLGANSLSGNLPDQLFQLQMLETLSIPFNNFTGQLGERLGELSRLKSLVLSGNRLSGPVPDVFGNLTLLQRLIADSNSFSGELPRSLWRLSMLRDLDLRNNSLSGPIGIDFSKMKQLASLDLATNHLHGPLPSSLSNCRKLKMLSLAKNSLIGQIPDQFRNLVSLSFLSLSNNSFTNISGALSVLQGLEKLNTLVLTRNFHGEEVPRDSFAFANLMIFAVGNCGLRGQIPPWLMKCKQLQVLDLSWNRLSGTIPPWIGKFENLIYLDISNNSLTGEIPRSLTNLKSLVVARSVRSGSSLSMPLFVKHTRGTSGRQYNQLSSFPPSLYLNDNRFNGTIWPEFGHLRELHVLDLSSNNISGAIPGNLSEMENIEVLDLSHNNLSGSIPRSLSKLTFLSKFSVAHNHLVGKIPTDGQFFSFSDSSFEDNPGLCRENNPCNHTNSTGATSEIAHVMNDKIGKRSILGITIGIGLGIAFLFTVVLLNMPRRVMGDPADDEDLEDRPHRSSDVTLSTLILFNQGSETKGLTIADLLRSTNNFDQANIIGCGGFGLVYKACLPDGKKAAIKKLSGDCGEMEREFHAEVEALSRAQHKNLVSLEGYCKHGNDRWLIYSYMENGSLDYWLHERVDNGSSLRWESRLKIAQGSARGLAYLHKVCEPNIIHRDVKSSNILLDDRFEAHLADFGLSRLIRPYDTHVTTDLVGTLGYIPPEYSQTLTATLKGDVFSFGVVLLELITGRRPVDVCKGRGCRDLISWVFQMKTEKKEEQIFDPSIWNKAYEDQLLTVLEIACKCISTEPRRRPMIEDVVSWLDNIGANS